MSFVLRYFFNHKARLQHGAVRIAFKLYTIHTKKKEKVTIQNGRKHGRRGEHTDVNGNTTEERIV